MQLMRLGLKPHSRNLIVCMVALIMFFSILGLANPGPAYAKTDSSPPADSFVVNINDNGEIIPVHTYTIAEMQALSVSDAVYYSSIDAMPAPNVAIAKGVLFSDLVADINANYNANINISAAALKGFKLYATDGWSSIYKYNDIFGATRYYYPRLVETWDSENQVVGPGAADNPIEVQPLFALSSYQDRFLTDLNHQMLGPTDEGSTTFRFCFGQTATELTNSTPNNFKFGRWVNRMDINLPDGPAAPVLTPDSTENTVGNAAEITFDDNQTWRDAISIVRVNGINLTTDQYTKAAGKITIAGTVFTEAKDYTIYVKANNYKAATVTQTINEASLQPKSPPDLTADSSDNKVGQPVDITFTDDSTWRGKITGITVKGTSISTDSYSVGEGKITVNASAFTATGDYAIAVKATGYNDATVMQTMSAYSVTIDSKIIGGTIIADKTSPTAGETVTLTVTPTSGKKLMANSLKYTSDGTKYTVINGTNFNMPAANVTVTAIFITESANTTAWDGSIDTSWYDTVKTSFEIGTPAKLAGLAAIVNGTANGIAQDVFKEKTVTLMADIDLGGVQNQDKTWDTASAQWMAIGGGEAKSAFNGTFDGSGHIISNIYIERQAAGAGTYGGRNQGLFGIADSAATVKNLGVTGYVAANRSVGGVVGKNNGKIECCFNAATVIGTDSKGVGGIVGANWNSPSIINCYNLGSVLTKYGTGVAGGIAGDNEYQVSNCYNAGPITSNSSPNVGGIVGNIKNGPSNPKVTDCYYNSALNDKGIGYYDTKTYTETNVAGKTAEQMKTTDFVTLLNGESGSAFVQDTNNINNGYPILFWQAASQPTELIPPTLLTDTTDNTIGNPIDITFTDNAAWRNAITEVKVGDTLLDAAKYTKTEAGKITIAADVFTAAQDYTITIRATGYQDASVTVLLKLVQGEAVYTISPVEDAIYTIGTTPDGIKTMTVKSDISGFNYFSVSIAPLVAHDGKETILFTHLRDGVQLELNATEADFDAVNNAQAGFNVKPGDVIKVYPVDRLSNDANSNPIILQ